jgi:hypothetical protein
MNHRKSVKGTESSQEKTGFEKFEAELKDTIFAVIFILVKDEDESLLYAISDGVIELFQLLSFPFLSVRELSSNSIVVRLARKRVAPRVSVLLEPVSGQFLLVAV